MQLNNCRVVSSNPSSAGRYDYNRWERPKINSIYQQLRLIYFETLNAPILTWIVQFYHSFTPCTTTQTPLMSDEFDSLLKKLNDIQWDAITSLDNLPSLYLAQKSHLHECIFVAISPRNAICVWLKTCHWRLLPPYIGVSIHSHTLGSYVLATLIEFSIVLSKHHHSSSKCFTLLTLPSQCIQT